MDLLVDEFVHSGLTHEPRPAVDLGATRATLGRLAVPAAGKIVREVGLDVMDGVEHDHALDGGHFETLLTAARRVATEDLQHDLSVVRGGRRLIRAGSRLRRSAHAGIRFASGAAVLEDFSAPGDAASSKSPASSGGICGTGRCLSLTVPASLYAMKLTFPSAGSFSR